MRLNFKVSFLLYFSTLQFTGLLGTTFKSGNLIFTRDGNGLISPVGNQLSLFSLKQDEALTLQLNSSYDTRHLTLSPDLAMLIAVNEIGEVSVISMITGTVVSVYPMRHPVTAVSFSPNGRFLIAGALDNSARIFSVNKHPKLIVYTLCGHRNPVVGCYFFENSLDCITVSNDGNACLWQADARLQDMKSNDVSKSEGKVLFNLNKRFQYFSLADASVRGQVTSSAFHRNLSLLATGFDTGLLMLHSLPDFTLISEVQLFTQPISTLAINQSGEWIAVGSDQHGQLAVWEWRSHLCHLRAESHSSVANCLAYSPDGLLLASGGSDALIKVWRLAGNRSLVTFSEHEAGVTGLAFPSARPKVVLSASLDGTVRAFDLTRYRNFRVMHGPPNRLVQLSSVSVDATASLAAAGGLDSFEAYLWSVKTGLLLTCLDGHSGPVSDIAFSPDLSGHSVELVTSSWDKSVRLWEIGGQCQDPDNPSALAVSKECVNFSTDALCVAFRGDGKEIAIALLSGTIAFYNPVDGQQTATIDGQSDLGACQTSEDSLITPKRMATARKFQALAYSTDGTCLLAGGDSKYICLYSIKDRALVKRFEVSCNLSLDGVQDTHDRRRFLASQLEQSWQVNAVPEPSLPVRSSRHGVDKSSRQLRPSLAVSSLQFSPTGDAFAACTTEGVLVYSLSALNQLPSLFGGDTASYRLTGSIGRLDELTTPKRARDLIGEQPGEALDIALRLNIPELIEEIIEQIPDYQVDYLARQLSLDQVVNAMLTFLARQLGGKSRHVGFYLHWTDALLQSHAANLRSLATKWTPRQPLLIDDDKADEPAASTNLWSTCQARLVRLQTSLSAVKSNVVDRVERVENTWSYLEAILALNEPKQSDKSPTIEMMQREL